MNLNFWKMFPTFCWSVYVACLLSVWEYAPPNVNASHWQMPYNWFCLCLYKFVLFWPILVGAGLPTLKIARGSPPRAASIACGLILVYMVGRNCLNHSQVIFQKYFFLIFLKIRDFNSNLEKSLSVHKWPFLPTKTTISHAEKRCISQATYDVLKKFCGRFPGAESWFLKR